MYENTLPHKLAIEDHLRASRPASLKPLAAEVLAEVDMLLHLDLFTYHWNRARKAHGLKGILV